MLQGREELVTRLVDEKYDALVVKHAALAVDGRAETHLQVECTPRLPSEQLFYAAKGHASGFRSLQTGRVAEGS